MRYVFLLNKFSLKKKLPKTIHAIEEVCTSHQLDYKIEVNSEETSTEDLVQKYKDDKVVLMAVGGDGTINRVLNEMVPTKNMLGWIPSGTGNDLNRTAKECFKKGINYIDLIKINERYFINVACFGIDSDIGNNDTFIHSKIIPEKQRYNMGLIYHFLKFKPRYVQVKAKRKIYEKDVMTVVICNARYYGGGYKVGYHSNPMDGKIEVYIADKMSKLKMAQLTKGMNKGLLETSNKVTKISCKELEMESSVPMEGNTDGEKIVDTKYKVQCIPKGIKIYYNPELIQEIKEKISELR